MEVLYLKTSKINVIEINLSSASKIGNEFYLIGKTITMSDYIINDLY